MIRREGRDAAGNPTWVLISQVDHALISGAVAEAWDSGAVDQLRPRQPILDAVYHHDDGWQAWESLPATDPDTGQPLDFTEMPLVESLAIWSRSIEVSQHYGVLPAWAVSGHFAALLERSLEHRAADGKAEQLARHWLVEQEAARAGWLEQLAAQMPDGDARQTAEHALKWLQLFDVISLWLCCAERFDPFTPETPGGVQVCFTPISAETIEVAPWPLAQPELSVGLDGREVPRRQYLTAQQLADVPGECVRLSWTFRPATGLPPRSRPQLA